MTRFRVLPYKQGSRSAKALAEALDGKVLRLEGSTFTPKTDDVVINWGSSKLDHSVFHDPFCEPRIINYPTSLGVITDKLQFFYMMESGGVTCIPAFWTSRQDIPSDAYPVVCRTVLCGHSGAGVVIAYSEDALVDAPLYTKYMRKKDEYRIHVGKIIDPNPCAEMLKNQDGEWELNEGPCLISVQKKARRFDCAEPNWQVRNHQNGFVYKREDVNPPACVIQAAYSAFDASGLDFGAVDVIYQENTDRAFVLEINTAPGLCGTTIEDYASFFRSISESS